MARKAPGPAGSLSQAATREIRAELARQMKSQAELAKTIGKSANYVSTRLRDLAPLTLNDIESMAHALNMDSAELFRLAVSHSRRDS